MIQMTILLSCCLRIEISKKKKFKFLKSNCIKKNKIKDQCLFLKHVNSGILESPMNLTSSLYISPISTIHQMIQVNSSLDHFLIEKILIQRLMFSIFFFDALDKVILGGHSGILRIYGLRNSKLTSDQLNVDELRYDENDILLEMQFPLPILQINSGILLSASEKRQLFILFPNKFSVYSVTSSVFEMIFAILVNLLFLILNFSFRSFQKVTKD